MQTLDVISVNIWQMLVSLANLVLIFLMVKKFLYKPVMKMLSERQSTINKDYDAADEAKRQAMSDKIKYEYIIHNKSHFVDDVDEYIYNENQVSTVKNINLIFENNINRFESSLEQFKKREEYNYFNDFMNGKRELSFTEKTAILNAIYNTFIIVRPTMCGIDVKLNETDFFCFVLTCLNADTKQCAQILCIEESSVRSCKSRLKNKLEPEALIRCYSTH